MFYQFTRTTAGREPCSSIETIHRHFFKLKCCTSCSYCTRAFAKERSKSCVSSLLSLSKHVQSKIWERCFLCHSIVLCKLCSKCQNCCTKSACRGETSKLLANLAGSGCRSESASNSERGLLPPLSDLAKAYKVSHSRKLLCQSPQEQVPVGGITLAYRQKRSRTGSKSNISRVLQSTILGPKAQQQMETYTRSEQIKSLPQGGEIQNRDIGNHQDIPPTRGMGHVNRLQRRLLSYTNTGTVQEIPEISCPGSDLPIKSTALWSVHSALGVHCGSKRGETDGHTQGYKDLPVHRRLVGESQVPPNLSPAYPNASENVPRSWLAGECRKIRAGTQAGFQLCRLPVRPQVRLDPTDTRPVADSSGKILKQLSQVWSGLTYTGPVAEPSRQNTGTALPNDLSGPGVHVLDSFINSHGKTGSSRTSPHETNTMAFEKQLESTGIPTKGDSNPQVLTLTFTMVARRKECTHRPTITPSKTCSANFYRHIKRRVGRPLSRTHCKRNLVPAGKQTAYKLALKEFQDLCSDKIVLIATDNTTVVSYKTRKGA